jgi:hypothetical protein
VVPGGAVVQGGPTGPVRRIGGDWIDEGGTVVRGVEHLAPMMTHHPTRRDQHARIGREFTGFRVTC